MNVHLRTLPLLALAVAACRVGPDHRAPELAAPAAWVESSAATTAAPADPRWWRLFDDRVLDELVRRALAHNHDVRIAAARVREVRARHGVARSSLPPTLDAASAIGTDHVSGDGEAADIAELLRQDDRTTYSAGFDASWELDVFGGRAREVEAAAADVAVAEEDRQATIVSLLGEVGRTYVELRGAQRQSAVYRESARTARETLELTQRLRTAGLATELDLSRARAQLAELEAELPKLEASERQAIHRLGFLVGEEPGVLLADLGAAAPIPSAPATVLVGLPSDLVRRRPDLRREERALAAATARVGVATADLYPRFSLTAALGLQALGAEELLGADTRVASLGGGARIPIFDGGRARSRVAAEGAAAERALAAYERSYLAALAEVEDALVAYTRELDRRRSLEQSARASRDAARLARELFEGGLTTFLDALDAERVSYSADAKLAQSETAIATSLVRLYKSLGGGWELDANGDVVAAAR